MSDRYYMFLVSHAGPSSPLAYKDHVIYRTRSDCCDHAVRSLKRWAILGANHGASGQARGSDCRSRSLRGRCNRHIRSHSSIKSNCPLQRRFIAAGQVAQARHAQDLPRLPPRHDDHQCRRDQCRSTELHQDLGGADRGSLRCAGSRLDSFSSLPEKPYAGNIPLRRPGAADEIAKAVLFPASGHSSCTAGIGLVVDGGLAQI
jgi:hypothetical protein